MLFNWSFVQESYIVDLVCNSESDKGAKAVGDFSFFVRRGGIWAVRILPYKTKVNTQRSMVRSAIHANKNAIWNRRPGGILSFTIKANLCKIKNSWTQARSVNSRGGGREYCWWIDLILSSILKDGWLTLLSRRERNWTNTFCVSALLATSSLIFYSE